MLIFLMAILGIAILAVVLYFALSGKTQNAAEFDYFHTQRTLESGTPASARILELHDKGGRLNANPVVEFKLEVYPESGAPFIVVTRAIISTIDLAKYQPGATIPVKYDPSDPSSVAVVLP
jgi:hypothetical protein